MCFAKEFMHVMSKTSLLRGDFQLSRLHLLFLNRIVLGAVFRFVFGLFYVLVSF